MSLIIITVSPMSGLTDDSSGASNNHENGELPHLDTSEWDPPSKVKPNVSESDAVDGRDPRKSCSPSEATAEKRRGLTFEEILRSLEEKVKELLRKTDYITLEVRTLLKFIQRQTRYNPDVILNKRLTEKIVKFGIAHVFLRIWDSVNKVDYLSKKNILAFKNLQTILSIIWNCSDKSPSLCDAVSRCGLIQLFISELGSERFLTTDLTNENQLYLVKAYLGILHNIMRMCLDSRKLFRSADAVTVLQLYLDRGESLVKTKAYLILAYIINEEENELINATDENIKFILSVLANALESENHFSKPHAFWATELACGLNHLAVNDVNKVRMGRLGAFPLYLKLVQSDNVDEQNLGAAGLWILSFNDENKALLRKQPDCLRALEELATSDSSESIRRAARGALWVVRTYRSTSSSVLSTPERRAARAAPSTSDTSAERDIAHVMISYNHRSGQEIMIPVKDKLRSSGYKVWMDVDNMSGSTLEAMALAVEQASVVLVCMTQGYKDSSSCRTEAEYTYHLRKDIIPLLLQADYCPDGWLGLMIGTRLHFDMTTKENVEAEVPRLVRELGLRGRIPGKVPAIQSNESNDGSGIQSCLSVCSMHSYGTKEMRLLRWDRNDVSIWLQHLGLDHLADRLSGLDGPLLVQYRKMMNSAPHYFYHTLEDMLHLNLMEILQFTKALDDLKV